MLADAAVMISVLIWLSVWSLTSGPELAYALPMLVYW